MHGTLSCPVCGTTGIALGSPACPHCAVGFAAPVVNPVVAAPVHAVAAPVHAVAAPMHAATAPAPWSPTMHQPTQAPSADAVVYASIWRRIGAGIIDIVLLMIPFVILVGPGTYFADPAEGSSYFSWFIATEPWEYAEHLVWLAYVVALLASSKQATLGMQALDLRVVREDDLQGVGAGRALGRELLTYLSAIILFLGYLMIAFTPKRQALHDKIARTVVLHDQSR